MAITKQNVKKFKEWLTEQGATIVPETNEWELVRFKTENGISVLYTNKRGHQTPTNEMWEAMDKFSKGVGWKTVSRKRQFLYKKKDKLIKRDGGECFVCQRELKPSDMTIEHWLSFGYGGSDHEHNLAIVCRDCNMEMGSLPITKKIELVIERRRNRQKDLYTILMSKPQIKPELLKPQKKWWQIWK